MKLSNGLGSLTLQCVKCTRESTIAAPTMESAVDRAKIMGWVAQGGKYICPKCPAIRSTGAFATPVDAYGIPEVAA